MASFLATFNEPIKDKLQASKNQPNGNCFILEAGGLKAAHRKFRDTMQSEHGIALDDADYSLYQQPGSPRSELGFLYKGDDR